MDDLLIIILTLVLTVVAAINQGKKKKQQASSDTAAEPGFWESLMHEEDFPGDGEKKRQNPVVIEPVQAKPAARETKHRDPIRKSASPDSLRMHRHHDEGGRNEDVLTLLKSKVPDSDDPQAEGTRPPVLEDFSLRNAIIYSEIIHPKYF